MAWTETEHGGFPRYMLGSSIHTLSIEIRSAKAARIGLKKANYLYGIFVIPFLILPLFSLPSKRVLMTCREGPSTKGNVAKFVSLASRDPRYNLSSRYCRYGVDHIIWNCFIGG